ncbi:MAG: hypothetical protein ACE5GA_00215 [Candidatus Zixiibacteriota bacterium]
MLSEYLDLIEQGNLESAAQYWHPSARRRASRLGISYENIPIKEDLNSPVIKSAALNPEISVKYGSALEDGFFSVYILATHGGAPLGYHYYARASGGYHWLVYSQDYVARDWRRVESRFFRFHISPLRSRYFNRIAAAALDQFVDSVGHLLGVNRAGLRLLEKEKIDYYYCDDVSEVKRISGAEVRGLHDLASDALITSSFPHYHEVAHLLVNYRLKSLPLTTLPFLQEGLATYLGGRANRAPASLLDMASYLYRMDVVGVDSLLELMAFHNDLDASIAYSGAALFIKSLVDRYGLDRLLNLYLELSGNFTLAATFNSSAIRRAVEKHTGASWKEVLDGFRENYVTGGFGAADSYPRLRAEASMPDVAGNGPPQKPTAGLPGAEVSIIADRFYVRGLPNVSGTTKGTVFLGTGRDMEILASELYDEQFGQRPFPGRRFGIRFDQHEAGLYDYATSTLVAKYIASFDPGSEYYHRRDSTVLFSFPVALCGQSDLLLAEPVYVDE